MVPQGLGGEDVAHASTQCIACQLNGCCRSSWAYCSAFGCCWRCGCSADFSYRIRCSCVLLLKDPEVSTRLAAAGAETVSSERAQPEALHAHLKSEIDRWTPIIK